MGARDLEDEEALTAYQRWKKSPTYPWRREAAVGDRFDLGAFFYLLLLIALVVYWLRAVFKPFGPGDRSGTPVVRVDNRIEVSALTPIPSPTPTFAFPYVEIIEVVPAFPTLPPGAGDGSQ